MGRKREGRLGRGGGRRWGNGKEEGGVRGLPKVDR